MNQRSRISPEDLAALLDGRLEGAEREAVLHAVARDDEAFELFEESLHALDEERAAELRPAGESSPDTGSGGGDDGGDGGDGGGAAAGDRGADAARFSKPVRGPLNQHRAPGSFSAFRRPLKIAAVLAVALVGGSLWWSPRPSPSGRLAASFDSTFGVQPAEIKVFRSPTGPSYFLAGRSFFNLALALRSSDSEGVEEALEAAGPALSGDQPIDREIVSALKGLKGATLGLRTVRRQARDWELRLGEADSFALGRWYQAAMTALPEEGTADLAYFSRPAVQEQWRQVYEHRDSFAAAGQAIERIEGLLGGGVTADEVEDLRRALGEIANDLDPAF